VISCFKDKLRLVPSWIEAENFFWPYLNKIIFREFGLRSDASDEEKAAVCKLVTFQEFMCLLPKIYLMDPHVWPQVLSSQCKISKLTLPSLRIRSLQLEKIDFGDIPDFNPISKGHSSSSVSEQIALSGSELLVVRKLYYQDYVAGGYDLPVLTNI